MSERATYQRCLNCGTEEVAGSYCTWCRWEEYDLVLHDHPADPDTGGVVCPLGSYMNPGPQYASGHASRAEQAIADARARLATLDLSAYHVVHHNASRPRLSERP